MKVNLTTVPLIVLTWTLCAITSFAQAPDWQVTNNSLGENMTMVTLLQLEGEFITEEQDIVAAFSGDEVRGVGSPSVVNNAGERLVFLVIQGDIATAEISFKIYDASTNMVKDAVTTVAFIPDSQLGSESTPFITTDNYLPSSVNLSNESVLENLPANTVVGALSTEDQDVSDTHTYALADNVPDNEAFLIVDNELATATPLNFEAQSSYTVSIITTDNKGASFTQTLEIMVGDDNDPPSAINLTNPSFDENQPSNSFISNIIVVDEDSADTYNFSLTEGGAGNDMFIIEDGQLKTNASFDAESTPTVTVSILAEEVNGDLSIQQEIVLDVLDVNDAPILNDTTFIIEKDASINSEVGQLLASDQDTDQALTFTISFDSPGDAIDFPFSINSMDGVITLTSAIDFDFDEQYIFNVQVMDDGDGNLSDVGQVTIKLEDVIGPVLPANNYISPNNDGLNDVFFIENVELFQDYILVIIDQYGNVVLKQDRYQNDWDGIDSSGRELASGVYFYSMKASGAPYTYTGSITLFRE